MFSYFKSLQRLAFATALVVASFSAQAGWLDDLKSALKGDKDKPAGIAEQVQALSDGDINKAFKQALDLGSQQVVEQLSTTGGFNADSLIRIPLPSKLEQARDLLTKVGLEGELDELEVRLNRAAESATPQAKALFTNAIKEMSFDDIRGIYEGSDNAATLYFQDKMTPSLTTAMEPIISSSLLEVGALKQYDDLIKDYKKIPFVPDLKADLTEHVINGSLNGVFYYLAEQEAAIRKDPVKQTTELLKRVFGVQ